MAKRVRVSAATPSAPSRNVNPLDRRVIAADGLMNLTTGMGGEKDKLANTVFGYAEIGKGQLDAAYRGDWISRKIVNIPAFDAFREWRDWTADAADISAIEQVEKFFGVQRKTMLALQRGRLYGGGALIMGVDQGLSHEPLEIEKLGKDCLKFLHVVSRHELSAGPMEWNLMSPWYGQPQYYTRSGTGQATQVQFHPSRVIRFLGEESPDVNISNGWGDSILQICADAVLSCGMVASSVAQMVAEAKLDVIKIPGLSDNISNTAYEDKLKSRFAAASTIKSVFAMLILDKEEEWERINQNFSSLPDVMKAFLLIASGAADIPATRFLSQSPTGMSATGESDIRNYYDRISTEQNVVITPAMGSLDEIIIRSALGARPAELWYAWAPLWQMDEAQKAEIASKKAAVMTADVNAALISPIVLQKARENQLIEDGTYPGLELIIEEFGDDVDEREVEPVKVVVAANENDPTAQEQAAGTAISKRAVAANDAMVRSNRIPSWVRARTKAGREWMADASTPRPLYVRRDVLNADVIKAWAKEQGFATSLSDMHVTITYSKKAVDWLKMGDTWMHSESPEGHLTIKPGGPRVVEAFGKAIVLAFSSTELAYRNMAMRENGASYDYDDYTPHVTITYDLPAGLDIAKVVPYRGEIVLGPEIFEEIKPDFDNERDVIEDHKKPARAHKKPSARKRKATK